MVAEMIKLFAVHMPQGAFEPLVATLMSGYLAQGPKVDEFEEAFGRKVGALDAVAVNSGTAALTLALRLANVEPGDAVITTPMTCTATNLPILSLGAGPVWADVDPVSGLIDPDSVVELIEKSRVYPRYLRPKVKAIMCVDWGGMPCDLSALIDIGAKYEVPLIEDAAHALGAVYHGRPVGSWADFTCFSLQAIKHITTGDGGVLTCLEHEDALRARNLRWFGIDRTAAHSGDSRIDVDIHEWGYKFHMNDVAATLGLSQLSHLSKIVREHMENAEWYDQVLPGYFTRVREPDGVRSAWWVYTVLLPSRRDQFVQFMAERGVQVSRVHRRNDEYSVFKPYGDGRVLAGVDEFSRRMVCLPCHWALTDDDRSTILQACEDWARQ